MHMKGSDARHLPRAKKLLLILVGVVLLLAIAGGGAFSPSASNVRLPRTPKMHLLQNTHRQNPRPPVYLPLENMVVNLADPGGETWHKLVSH